MTKHAGPGRAGRGLIGYFAVAYGVSWGGILLYIGSLGFDFSRLDIPDLMVLLALMLAGPSSAGLLMTVVTGGGRRGLRELLGRLARVRVPVPWYLLALIPIPLLLLAVLVPLSAWVSPAYTPTFLAFGIVAGLLAGLLEEIGWTGYTTPRLLARFSWLHAGLILGLAWAGWHGLADFAGNASTMGLGEWAARMVICWMIPLTAYRILMTWAYARHGSLALGILMHAGYTGWLATLTMEMQAASGPQALLWQALFALGLCAMVGVIALSSRHAPTAAVASPVAT